MRVRHIEIVCDCNRTILVLLTHKKGDTPRRYTCPYCQKVVPMEELLKDVHLMVGWTVA